VRSASPAARYVTLTALRWFPVGLVIPVMVLLMQSRGLDLASIGLLTALYSVVTASLELPTGGLADVSSRRLVLAASSLVGAAGSLFLALSTSHAGLAVAMILLGTARALGSGPLEAWYVDSVRLDDSEAAIGSGISRAHAAEAIALGVGAVIGGFVPGMATSLWPGLGASEPTRVVALSVPVMLAAGMLLAHAVAALALLGPDRGSREEAGTSRPSVLGTVGNGLRLAAAHPGLRRLMGYAALLGMLLAGIELISPGTFAVLLGGEDAGSAGYGLLVSAGFGASALGAMLSGRIAGRFRSVPSAAAICTVLAGAAALAVGVPLLGVAGTAYVLVYLLIGVTGPMVAELIHDRVGSSERSTVLSIESLVLQVGGVVSAVAVGGLVTRAGLVAGYAVLALVMLAAAVLVSRVPAVDRAATPPSP
jgi:MFS family permease